MIRKCCPLCEQAGCARWKGYYLRRMICSEMEFEGKIAIHVGHCKQQGHDFSMLPSFLLPRQQISRLGFEHFLEVWKKAHQMADAREQFADGIAASDEDGGTLCEKEARYGVPRSTAYQWLYALIVRLRLHAGPLQIEPPLHFSVFELVGLPLRTLVSCLEIARTWRVASALVLIPP
jgi:hypothetical protein